MPENAYASAAVVLCGVISTISKLGPTLGTYHELVLVVIRKYKKKKVFDLKSSIYVFAGFNLE